MIAFVTFFLGLTFGVQPVEVAVGEEVARVELHLGGEVVATMDGPPWRTKCSFGDFLIPQFLEAVAFDAEGEEIARTHQWVNLPSDPVAVDLVLAGKPGRRSVRLAWEYAFGDVPDRVQVTFDGRKLNVDDPHRFDLPPHDPESLHFLSVELDFSDGHTSMTELTFGGTYADEVSTELTAVPVEVDGKKARKLTVEDLTGYFAKAGSLNDGEALRVVAVEKGKAEIIIVVDREYRRHFVRMIQGISRQSFSLIGSLSRDHRLRFLAPVPTLRQGVASSYNLYPTSQELGFRDGSLPILLARYQAVYTGEQQIADAVAVAGLVASRPRRRRAVVLLLGEKDEKTEPDASELRPAMSRTFLETLHVPFFVWSFGERDDWGEARNVSSFPRFSDAIRDLDRALERQWIVWIDGRHLPQEIELSPDAEGLRIAR